MGECHMIIMLAPKRRKAPIFMNAGRCELLENAWKIVFLRYIQKYIDECRQTSPTSQGVRARDVL